MRFGWCPTADNAWLRGDELAVLLIAQANGFRRNATTPGASVIRGSRRRDCDCIFNRSNKWLLNRRFRIFCRRRMQLFLTSGRRHLDRCELFTESGFDRVGVGGDQRVLGGKVLVDPVGGIVGGLKLAMSASNCSRSAADGSGPRTVRARTDGFLPARESCRAAAFPLPPRLVAVARLRRPCERRRPCWRRPPSRLRQDQARRDRLRRRCPQG